MPPLTDHQRALKKAKQARYEASPKGQAYLKRATEKKKEAAKAKRAAFRAVNPIIRKTPEERLAAKRAWRDANPDRVKELRRAHSQKPEVREKANARRRLQRATDPVLRAKEREWKRAQEKRKREQLAPIRQAEREAKKVIFAARKKEAARLRRQKLYREDPVYRLRVAIRSRIRDVLKGKRKPASCIELVGCTMAELKIHLESQFTPGMSWDRRHEWHIDHIQPLCAFDTDDPIELAKACHWTNLRPLWAADNQAKAIEDAKLRYKKP